MMTNKDYGKEGPQTHQSTKGKDLKIMVHMPVDGLSRF